MRNCFQRAGVLLCVLAATLGSPGAGASGQTPPPQLKKSNVGLFDSESIFVDGPFPGLILIPNSSPNYHDEKYGRPYHLACHVYAAAPKRAGDTEPLYRCRFLVCAADRSNLPFVLRIARLLLLLYGERHDRLGDDHSVVLPTVDVWLTEQVEPGLSDDTGGEQFQNQIYLYNIHRDRSDIEWAREIAHEYGHYGLPGISGFKVPEEWANGVLGERLFLKWIRDDRKTGRLKDEYLAIVTPDLLDSFYSASIWPLIARILRKGIEPEALTIVSTPEGMNYYTGLAMYVDTVYGSAALVDAISDTRSASKLSFPHASDFLSGFISSMRKQDAFTLNVPTFSGTENGNTIYIYLPAGTWSVGGQIGLNLWSMRSDARTGFVCSGNLVTARKDGWHAFTYTRIDESASPARLTFKRRG